MLRRLGFIRAAIIAGGLVAGWEPAWADWRALVAGLETYPDTTAVKGAVSSATDLAQVLRRRGIADVTLLTEGQASRASLLQSLEGLVERTRAGDVVLVSFDGLGRHDTATVGQRDLTVALLTAGAVPAHPGPDDVIAGADLSAFIRHVEDRGGRVILVADASFGTEVTRSHAPSSNATLPDGQAAGLAGDPDAPMPFARSLVLAASDPRFVSKAIHIPGAEGPRRALTYAVARALEGRADFNHDGEVSVPELVAYTARLVYQLSDQRQKLAALWPSDSLSGTAITRGIVIRATTPLGDLLPPAATAAADPPLFQAPGSRAVIDMPAGPPIRLAAATGAPAQLNAVAPHESAVQVVARDDDPDLIWDPGNRDVITPDGDLIAENVGVGDLEGVVDRTMALRRLKSMVIDTPQQVAVLPNDEVQRRGNVVNVQIGNASGRYLILFNIRSDGAVQPLYPQPNDSPLVTTPAYTLAVAVNAPLGADQVVAVTGMQRMTEIEKGLAGMSGRRTPVAAVQLLRDLSPPGTLVGSVSVYSGTP